MWRLTKYRAFSSISRHLKEEKLYFGRFTQQEYDEAAKIVRQQVENLEKQIKGTNDPRKNMGSMPTIPASPSYSARKQTISSLSDILEQSIKTTGPISLSAYMRQCLTNPEFGYYTTRDPLNSETGDFITSPEISQVFGEMIGVWFYSTWLAQGKPSKVRMVEFGPGKGTLMYDVMNSFNKLNKGNADISIVMIEASSVLKNEQAKLLCNKEIDSKQNIALTKWGGPIQWVETEKEISDDSSYTNFVLAHEFFDALPIKAFEKVSDGTWREFLVEHTKSVNNTQGQLPSPSHVNSNDEHLETEFHLTLAPKETPVAHIPKNTPRYQDLPVGSKIEICPDAQLYMSKMANLVSEKSGAVLVIDYGIDKGIPDSTLRGIYKHKFVSPFFKPGEVDLSIDVDFPNLVDVVKGPAVAKGHTVMGPREQGDWLHEIGIGYRIDQLIKSNQGNPEEQEKIYDSYLRLTNKDDKSMGKIYKFLAVLPPNSSYSPGFGI